MASRSSVTIDPVRNIIIATGSGSPPSDFLPGEGSVYTDYTTGSAYVLESSGWVILAAGGGGSTAWTDITGKPTTVSGYGITDVYTKTASDARYAAIATTLAGYGITDAYTKTAADARYLQLSGGTLTGALLGTTGSFSASLGAPLLNGIGSSSTSIVYQAYVTGDAHARGYWTANGLLAWGSGSATADTNLYRASSGTLKTDGSLVSGGSINALGCLYAGAVATARTAGDINARRSSTTGVLYFGDGTGSYLQFNATSYLLGNNGSSASLGVQGQVRATGWFQSGDLTGAGAELGVSSGTAILVGYNRSTSAYIALLIQGSTVDISPASGANPTCNSKIMGTIQFGTGAPTMDCVAGDEYIQYS